MPDFVRQGINTTGESWRNASCRSNEDCGARKGPQKVSINDEGSARRDIPDDVFKECSE